MSIEAPHFVLIGRNSQTLEKYRRELEDFEVSVHDFGADIPFCKSTSGIFVDVDVENHVHDLDLATKLTKNRSRVPVIAICEPSLTVFTPSLRLLKTPLRSGEVRTEALFWVLRKFEEDKTIQNERVQAKRELLKGLTHQMGNILLRILARADLVQSTDDPIKVQSGVSLVVKAAEQASQLVSALRDFAGQKLQITEGKISDALDAALRLQSERLDAQNIEVRKNGLLKGEEEPPCRLDLHAFTKLLSKLIENSVVAMPGGGVLALTMTAREQTELKDVLPDRIELRIEDSGHGMAKDVLKRAFEFGFSAPKGSTSGLGLSLAREVIEDLGGAIELKSVEGKGTEILIWLPQTTC